MRKDHKNKEKILDHFIDIMKSKFPEFQYVNAMNHHFIEKGLIGEDFLILVGKVNPKQIKKFRQLITDKIYSECENSEFPLIITLQGSVKAQPIIT